MKRFVVCLAVLLAFAPWGAPAAGAPPPFAAVMEAYLADFPTENPVYADALGLQAGADRLEDVSAAGHDKSIASLRAWRARFVATARPDDSVGVRADRTAMLDTLDAQLVEDQLLAPWRTNPGVYVNLLGQSVFIELAREGRPADERFGHIIARLRKMRTVRDAAIANLQHTTQPAQALASVQLTGVIQLYASLLDTAAKQGVSPAVRAQLAGVVSGAIDDVRAVKAFVDGPLKAHATDDPRIGAAAYTRLFPLITGVDLTPAELEQRARARIASTRAAMLAIARPMNASVQPPSSDSDGARLNAVVRPVLDKIAEQHATPDTLLDQARADVAENEAFLRRTGLIALPDPDTIRVRRTPPIQGGTAVASMETSGPFDPPTEPSYFNVDPIPADWSAARVASYFRENDDAGIHMLSIHEAVPGHYVQLRANNVNPSLVRRIFGNGSFIEGWACFTEGLMIEQGFRPDDSALKLTQLKWRLREATNALLDAEYHAGSLTHDQAISLMVDGAFQESSEAESKWHRLQLSHVQLATYFAGLDAIERARAASGLDAKTFAARLIAMGAAEPRAIPALLAAP
ncbi:MAG: DUF885 domain-containing protein [Candidatus Eremiobacteraeota bacterium]|nr:DUF885 domain-containing protein [Candidatus Eremiobacteraeota bacterium]